MKHFAKPLLVSAALCALTLWPAHAEMDVPALKAAIEKSFEADYPKLDALYKDIHAHPELAFEEVKTAAKLAAEMRALGFEVTEKVGKTGLVAIYKNGDGPTILCLQAGNIHSGADGGENRPRLCKSRQGRLERPGDVRGP